MCGQKLCIILLQRCHIWQSSSVLKLNGVQRFELAHFNTKMT